MFALSLSLSFSLARSLFFSRTPHTVFRKKLNFHFYFLLFYFFEYNNRERERERRRKIYIKSFCCCCCCCSIWLLLVIYDHRHRPRDHVVRVPLTTSCPCVSKFSIACNSVLYSVFKYFNLNVPWEYISTSSWSFLSHHKQSLTGTNCHETIGNDQIKILNNA